ncbi:MAG: HAD family phosphatase [Candidatus Anstonellaceae archaeon]
MQKKIEAILFDLDGVLVDATELHYMALNKALSIFGYEISREEHELIYNGLPTIKKLEILNKTKGFPKSLIQFVNEIKQAYTLRMIEDYCNPDYEKILMLNRLKKEGYKLAVCSNAVRKSVELMLQKTALIKYFDIILSNQDVTKPKPDPEIYLKAFEVLKIKPENSIIIEDASHGIAAAKASGAYVMEVSGYSDVNYDSIKNFIKKLEG